MKESFSILKTLFYLSKKAIKNLTAPKQYVLEDKNNRAILLRNWKNIFPSKWSDKNATCKKNVSLIFNYMIDTL